MKNISSTSSNASFTLNMTLTIFFLILVRQIKQTIDEINHNLHNKNQNKGSVISLLNNQIRLKEVENELNKNYIEIEQNEQLNSFQKLYYDKEQVSFEQSIEEKQEKIKNLEKKKEIYIINFVLMVISILLSLVSLYFISKILMQIFKQNNLSSQNLIQSNGQQIVVKSSLFQPQQSPIKKIFRWMMKRLILIVILIIIFIAVFKLF